MVGNHHLLTIVVYGTRKTRMGRVINSVNSDIFKSPLAFRDYYLTLFCLFLFNVMSEQNTRINQV